jgi:hypothetical protein
LIAARRSAAVIIALAALMPGVLVIVAISVVVVVALARLNYASSREKHQSEQDPTHTNALCNSHREFSSLPFGA